MITRQGNTVAEVIEEKAAPLECHLRFQGQYADAESGLHYNRFRCYEPEVGRFASQDPTGLRGGFHPSTYAPSPINWTDSLGLSSSKPILILGEDQDTVDEVARILNTHFCGRRRFETMGVPNPQWRGSATPFDTPEKLNRAVEWNAGWLERKINEGDQIVSIGTRSEGGDVTSVFIAESLKS